MDTITQENSLVASQAKDNTLKRRFSTLVKDNQNIVFKVALTYCWHDEDRVELQQEILTQLWRAFPKYDESKRFSTWMYRIALNVSISYVRKHSLRNQHIVPYDETLHDRINSSEEFNDDPRLEFLQRFIRKLDSLNRAVMLLYLEEHSYQDIANIIGISETNVATKISRLKQRVRKFNDAQSS